MYLKSKITQRKGQKEGKREILYLLPNTPHSRNGCAWDKLKPRVRSLFWVFHVDAEDQAFGSCAHAFPKTLTGCCMGTGLLDLELVPIWDAGIADPPRHSISPNLQNLKA